MCLDKVGKQVTLDADLEVWKEVHVEGKKEYTKMFCDNWILRQCLSFRIVRAKYRDRAVRYGSSGNYVYAKYISGFHCYAHKPPRCRAGAHLHSYIIPKGATITQGEGNGYVSDSGSMSIDLVSVIVTPVLINPRVRGALKLLQKGGGSGTIFDSPSTK